MSQKIVEIGDTKNIRIYPVYLDASKTVAEGRRVSKDLAIENPTAYSIAMALSKIGFDVRCELKLHPRDFFTYGCVDVIFKTESGSPINPEYPTKNSLLRKLKSIYEPLPTPEQFDPDAATAREFADLQKQQQAAAKPAAVTNAAPAATAAKKNKKK